MVKGGKASSDAAGGKSGKGKGKSDGGEKARGPPMSKKRMLDKMTALSLNPDDDERTQLSKKISWVLRQGQSGICEQHAWAKVDDLLGLSVFEGMTLEKLMAVVADSNAQKLRYQMRDNNGQQEIRAIPKNERKAQEGSEKKPAAASTALPAQVSGDSKLNPNAPVFESSTKAGAATAAAQNPYSAMMQSYAANPYAGYNPWAMMGMGMGMGYNPMSMYGAMPMMTPGMGATAAAGKYRGRIKSFNAEKGFGFIESADAKQQYGRDVFLHKAVIGDLKVGDEVMFSVETNKQQMPQARDVTPAVGGGGGGKGKGKKGGAKAKAKGKAKAGGKPPKEVGEVKEGEEAKPAEEAKEAAPAEAAKEAAEAAPAEAAKDA